MYMWLLSKKKFCIHLFVVDVAEFVYKRCFNRKVNQSNFECLYITDIQ